MRLNRVMWLSRHRLVTAIVVGFAMFALVVGSAVAAGKGKQHHHNGKQMLGQKLKSNGSQPLDKKGKNTITADVKDGKIAGVHVKHATKGDVPVKKYKSKSKTMPAQDSLGIVWVGYAYIDEDGYEEIYWFPYELILDGDTGAIEYVPAAG
jgi:hypothetical protein